MGHIYRVGRTWYLSYYDHDGQRIRRTARTQFREAAKLALKTAEIQIASGSRHRPPLALADFLRSYLHAQRPGLTTQTFLRYEDCLENLLGSGSPLSGLMLGDVTVGAVSQYVYWRLARGRSKASIEKEVIWLKAALTEAARQEHVSWEAIATIKDAISRKRFPVLRDAGRRRDRILFPHEMPILFDAAASNPTLHDALTVALWTGLRSGNIRLVIESQVDFSSDPAVIRYEQGDMKNRRSHTVYLCERVRAILWQRWQGIPDRQFFRDFRPAWKRLQKRLASALPGLRFHDLRRTYITYRLAAGVDPKTVQAEVGHSDSRMTMDCYARAIRDPGIRAWAVQHFRFRYDTIMTERPERNEPERTKEDLSERSKLR